MAWTDGFQFINKHTMFLLQLHPMYRAFYAVVYAIWGSALLYYGSKYSDNSCAMHVARLDIAVGVGLCLGSLAYLVGLVAKKHHYQGDEKFPFPKILVVDWLMTAFVGFFGFGILNFWYWGFVTEDDCPHDLKNITLAYVIYCYVQLILICYAVVCIAFQVSGPSYIYQDVAYDMDPPDFLIQKFGQQQQHYGSTISLHVPDYPEPRLADNPKASEIERRSYPPESIGLAGSVNASEERGIYTPYDYSEGGGLENVSRQIEL